MSLYNDYRFLSGKRAEYREAHCNEEIVRDFIAGMTDRFFVRLAPAHMRPKVADFTSAGPE